MDPVARLKACPLFAELSPEILSREILPLGQLRQYTRGTHILSPQDRLNQLGIVMTRRIQILHIFDDGSESLSTVVNPSGVLGIDLIATESRLAPYHAVAAGAVSPSAKVAPARSRAAMMVEASIPSTPSNPALEGADLRRSLPGRGGI